MKVLKTVINGEERTTFLPENAQEEKELLSRMTKDEAGGPESLADAAARQAGHDTFSDS